MKKYYRDFYGASASITEHRNGTATLVVFCAGKRERKTYKSVRGAKIAMGKSSDGWWEVK